MSLPFMGGAEGGMAAIPTTYLYGGVIALLGMFFVLVLVLAFVTRIPFFKNQLMAQVQKRPGLFVDSVNSALSFFPAKRAGKKKEKNNLDLPEYLATKFEPQSGFAELWDRMPTYSYFTKGSNALKAEQVKALHDFRDYMGKLGYTVTPELIDVLFVEGLDTKDVYEKELEQLVLQKLPAPISIQKQLSEEEKHAVQDIAFELDNINNELAELQATKAELLHDADSIYGLMDANGNKIKTLQDIRADLETKVIKDGLFVWDQVEDLVFANSDMNSNNMSEAISIANAEALSNADKGKGQMDYAYAVIVGVTALIGIVIVMKFAFGS